MAQAREQQVQRPGMSGGESEEAWDGGAGEWMSGMQDGAWVRMRPFRVPTTPLLEPLWIQQGMGGPQASTSHLSQTCALSPWLGLLQGVPDSLG